jgi:mannosyl-3-phosphoglycerate phosphatase family protein
MLAPHHVIFTAVEGTLIHAASGSWSAALDALETLGRRGVPLILSSRGTRAQLETFRRKIEHRHPFLTESGGGLFIPDGYFSLRLEGATRVGRHFCVPFARPYAEAAAAVEAIAAEAGASVVGFSQMSAREIARNSGQSPREAELSRQREFSELFFFAGEAEKAARRFSEIARNKGWEAVPGDPFWELRSRVMRNGEPAARYLMGMYRKSLRVRLRSVGIGSNAEDLHLLSAVDMAIVLPLRTGEWDAALISRLPRAARGEEAGPGGWSQAIIRVLEAP